MTEPVTMDGNPAYAFAPSPKPVEDALCRIHVILTHRTAGCSRPATVPIGRRPQVTMEVERRLQFAYTELLR